MAVNVWGGDPRHSPGPKDWHHWEREWEVDPRPREWTLVWGGDPRPREWTLVVWGGDPKWDRVSVLPVEVVHQ